jgi:copper chaperone CopZ|tara:strand:+ start:2340 stop:2681 length:342 start_codon:yes stop_codon:yes gene_type:complete
MKKIIHIIMSVMIMGCANQITEIITPTTQCGMCDANIVDALNEIDGVKKIIINDYKQSVTIKYVSDKISINDLEIAISNAGYQANDVLANPTAYAKLALCCKMPKDRQNELIE